LPLQADDRTLRRLEQKKRTKQSQRQVVPLVDEEILSVCNVMTTPPLLMVASSLDGEGFYRSGIPFSSGSSNGGFWFKKIENALSFNGD
jgi:hypothetical protein